MKRIAIATTNAGKLAELEELLSDVSIVESAGEVPEVVEDGQTLHENAFKKARSAADVLGKTVLADDSGLFVEALEGSPGLYSARFSGPNANDSTNRAKLLDLMTGKLNRSAYFLTVICLCEPDQSLKDAKFFEGRCDGFVTDSEMGIFGFGYDSLFVPAAGDGRTFGQMDSIEKAKFSHRSKAIEAMRLWLTGLDI